MKEYHVRGDLRRRLNTIPINRGVAQLRLGWHRTECKTLLRLGEAPSLWTWRGKGKTVIGGTRP